MSEKPFFSDAERRKHKRASDIFIVTYRLRSPFEVDLRMGDKEYAAVALDIGQGGVGVDVGQEIPVGAEVRLKFEMVNALAVSQRNQRHKFELDGQSRYCRSAQKNSFRVGILFGGVSAEESEFISEYVKDQSLSQYEG